MFCPSLLKGRQKELDAALVNMVVKDLQHFTIVVDMGFRAFMIPQGTENDGH